MRILVTGGCGFIGHHFINQLLLETDWDIVVLDSLTYASEGFDRLRDINCYDDKRVTILSADFTRTIKEGLAQEIGDTDFIVHMGAETHVDNSITNARPFVLSNVLGTYNLLEFARTQNHLKKFLYFSTDEVFGPAPDGVSYKEWDRYDSGNPYAATKAGGEELCLAFANTYKLPMIITHTMNVFGERQHHEKYIPMCINKILNNETITIHSDKTQTIPGSRFYIHARNVASAVHFLLTNDVGLRDKFNIVGEREVNNLELAQLIGKVLDKEVKYKLVDFHGSRPGHDLRYALDGTKLQEMGYYHPRNFEGSLRKTIEWSLKPENTRWIGMQNAER